MSPSFFSDFLGRRTALRSGIGKSYGHLSCGGKVGAPTQARLAPARYNPAGETRNYRTRNDTFSMAGPIPGKNSLSLKAANPADYQEKPNDNLHRQGHQEAL